MIIIEELINQSINGVYKKHKTTKACFIDNIQ